MSKNKNYRFLSGLFEKNSDIVSLKRFKSVRNPHTQKAKSGKIFVHFNLKNNKEFDEISRTLDRRGKILEELDK